MPKPEIEPAIRLYLKEREFKLLLDKLEEVGWDHPVRWKIRTKWSEHQANTPSADVTPMKRAALTKGRRRA